MTYLLDTNVVSELRKSESRVASAVRAWAEEQPVESLFISVVTLMELEVGVRRVERRDPAQGRILRRWIDARVLPGFDGRILSVDSDVAQAAGGLHVPDPRPERDAFIAATAIVNDLVVVTRNVDDFTPTGVVTLDPWTG